MNQFSELPLCSVLQSNLARHKFVQPTPVQVEAIPPALEGRDVVATAQTGTGKTLAFLIPLLETLIGKPGTGIQSVILTPTRELAIQIDQAFALLAAGTGIRAGVVVGGLNESTQLRAISRGAQVLVATPGRLCDFLNRKLVNLANVRFFVLDEADRMLDMGFLPALRLILNAIPAARQTLFFSATMEKSVAHLVGSYVRNPVRVAVGVATQPAGQVDLHVYEVDNDRKVSLLVKLLNDDAQGSFLVFARTKHGTDRLAKKLSAASIKTGRIHGNRTQSQRNQVLAAFKNGEYRVLVATDVAARGIHVDGIAHVVNFDLPQVPGDFIHRVGRTGRAGARGMASTFHTRGERSEIRNIERELNIRMIPQAIAPGELTQEPAREQSKIIVMPTETRKRPPARFTPRRRVR